jgi:hypothetical protein
VCREFQFHHFPPPPPADDPAGLTREEIWDAPPPEVRKNEVRFKSVLEAEAGTMWEREQTLFPAPAFDATDE